MGYTVTVLTPSNSLEVYNSPAGLTQWHTGLPIPVADTVQVTAAVASGEESIKGLSVTLDGKDLPSVSVPPWTETFVGGSLTIGDHDVVVSTALNDKHKAVAKISLTFSVVAAMPKELQSPASTVVTSVKGAQQLLLQGAVSTIDPATAAILPPVVGATGQQTSDPGVDLAFNDDEATNQRKSDEAVSVNGHLTAVIVSAPGSTDKQFVFAIYRDGNQVYASSALTPILGAGIRLQAQTDTTPGLLPGIVQVLVWGVDQTGNFSAPVIVSFSINNEQAPIHTKL